MRERLRDPAFVEQRRWFTLLVLCVSLVVIVLDNTILNVALPTLAKIKTDGGLGASASQLQWIVDSYVIVFAGLLLTAGSLGDRFGRYKALAFGLTVFGIGSAASAFAGSANVLIATRSLMGIGGAFIMPSTLSILTNVFTQPQERGKAIGVWAGVSALGLGIGPISGGLLLAHFWWGSIFLVNLPIVVLGLVCGYYLVPESQDPTAPKLDPFGAVLSIAAIAALLWAIIEAPSYGWTSGDVLAGFAVGGVLLVAFLAWELNYSSPMLDLHFFQNPRFSAASSAITITFFAMFAAPFSSVWVRRFGNKVVMSTGLLIVALSYALIATLNASSGSLQVILCTMVMGLGMGNVMAPATDSIMGSLPRAKAGVGSAVNDTTRQFGGAMGVAVFGSILVSRYADHLGSRLSGKIPAPLLDQAKESVGSALNIARTVPEAKPFAPQLIDAARESFVSGLHFAAVLAIVVLLIAAGLVARFLPARATDEEHPLDAVPMGIGPVDVTPADVAADLAEAIEHA